MRDSFAPGLSVHIGKVASHFTAATSSAWLAARLPFQLASHPLPAILACAPAPLVGAVVRTPLPAITNARNLPTVTSYLSSQKLLTVAG
jgi:hypothetical protein